VPLNEVKTIEVLESVSPSKDWGGWGIRITPSGHVGYICSSGSALTVTATGGKVYIFNVEDAEGLMKLLNEQIRKL
jgi:hypothetical protein